MHSSSVDRIAFDRKTNEVFAGFPWFNRTLDDSCTTANDPVLLHSIEKLRELTSVSGAFSDSADDHFIRGKLGLPFDPSHAGTGPMREYAYALFILRERLLDVALWLSKGAPQVETSRQCEQLPDVQGIPRYKKLRDWPILVREALAWFTRSPTPSPNSEASTSSLCMKHLQSFIARSKARELDCIHLNIDLAALYLSHLLAGNHDLEKSNAPMELFDILEQSSLHINGIKTPLHLALTVSPFCLLLPINFGRNLYGRPKMLQLWKALGSERPETLRLAEMELWRALFDVSTSAAVNTTDRFTLAFRNILDLMDTRTLTRHDLYFFTPSIPALSQIDPPAQTPPAKSVDTTPLDHREEEEEEEERIPSPKAHHLPMSSSQFGTKTSLAVPAPGPHTIGNACSPILPTPSPATNPASLTGISPVSQPFPGSPLSPPTPLSPMTPLTDPEDSINVQIPALSIPGASLNDKPMDVDTFDPPIDPLPGTNIPSGSQLSVPERKSQRISHAPQSERLTPSQALSTVKPLKKKRTKMKAVSKSETLLSPVPKIHEQNMVIEFIDLSVDNLPYPDITLKTVKTSQKMPMESSFKLYGCREDDYLDYIPLFHHKQHMEWYSKVIAGVKKSYHQGLPLHIAKPQESILKIIDFATFEALSPGELQKTFKTQHIVVTDYPWTPAVFDESAMDFMINPTKPITIHDLSIQPRSGDDNERHVIGLTADLLESHRSKDGKILNALDFPMPVRGRRPPESIATDRLAFTETFGDPRCVRRGAFPEPDMCWGLAATSHAFHTFHIDACGFDTFIAPQTGAKYWVLARPKAGESGVFSRTDLYVGRNFKVDDINSDLWDVEAVLLTPRTCLFMRPNTPHLVITPESAICHGGHLYATSTIRLTCHGILHTIIASSLLTNTEHTITSRDLLRRILAYFWMCFRTDYINKKGSYRTMAAKYEGKVPDVFTFDGLLDIYSICNIMELGNVLHYQTYLDGGVGDVERRKMIEGRVVARHIRGWLKSMIEIHHPDKEHSLLDLERDLFYPYLASQVAALVHYKKRASAIGVEGNSIFTLEEFNTEIQKAIGHDTLFMESYDPSCDPKTFDWPGVVLIVRPTRVGGYWPSNKLSGKTPDDKVWWRQRGVLMKRLAQDMDDDMEDIDMEDDGYHVDQVDPVRPHIRKKRRL